MKFASIDIGEIAATITDLERELSYYKRLSEAAVNYVYYSRVYGENNDGSIELFEKLQSILKERKK